MLGEGRLVSVEGGIKGGAVLRRMWWKLNLGLRDGGADPRAQEAP